MGLFCLFLIESPPFSFFIKDPIYHKLIL